MKITQNTKKYLSRVSDSFSNSIHKGKRISQDLKNGLLLTLLLGLSHVGYTQDTLYVAGSAVVHSTRTEIENTLEQQSYKVMIVSINDYPLQDIVYYDNWRVGGDILSDSLDVHYETISYFTDAGGEVRERVLENNFNPNCDDFECIWGNYLGLASSADSVQITTTISCLGKLDTPLSFEGENMVRSLTDGSEISYDYIGEMFCGTLTSTDEETTSGNIDIYPNPVTDYINIYAPGTNIDQVYIYTPAGQQVGAYNTSSKQKFLLDVTTIFSGMYIVVCVGADGGRVARKIIVER